MRYLVCSLFFLLPVHAGAAEQSTGYWSLEQANQVLDRTRRITLDPELSALTAGERAAVQKLIEAGLIMHEIYLDSRHPQSLDAARRMAALDTSPEHVTAIEDLFYLSKGPIATTLDNEREPFQPVAAEEAGKNVYPAGMTREQLDAFLAAHPERAGELMAVRTVVRAVNAANLQRDLAMLDRYPVLDALHPGLRARLESLNSEGAHEGWYALPYSLRWAPGIIEIHGLLEAAANDVRKDDPDFADYLSLRARDLLSDNYEAGDAAWVRGRFQHLNAQIGSYEVYDDTLYGVKSFFGFNVLVRDREKSRELADRLRDLQAIQDGLPFGAGRKVQQDIPVGVYNVVADFGQSRGANTATILPNEAAHARKYGRTILLRYNIMAHPELFADALRKYRAAVAPGHADDLTVNGNFYRTLWHEVGHYLGVDRTADERELNDALSPWGSHFEELKADLVSLYTSARLNAQGSMSDALLRSVQASGVLRVLQDNRPRTADQPYQAMQLMQMNYFLEHGLLDWDESEGRLIIRFDRYDEAATAMLSDVLGIQHRGNADEAGQFVERYTAWSPDLHGRLAERIKAATQYRFRMVRYQALD